MRMPGDIIPVESLPTRFDSSEAVTIWHARRVILDSASYQEAARRLGICKKTLWETRAKHHIREIPWGDASQAIIRSQILRALREEDAQYTSKQEE